MVRSYIGYTARNSFLTAYLTSIFILIFSYRSSGQSDTLRTDGSDTLQTEDTIYWKTGGLQTLTASQATLINWAAGGENLISLNGAMGLFADHKKAFHSWENSLDLAYGIVRQNNSTFVKSDDRINLVTKFGHQIIDGNTEWYFSGLFDLKSQFKKGFSKSKPDSVISSFLSPIYGVIGLGVDYQPNKACSFNYIPATGKFTFVIDDQLSQYGAYGVNPGHLMRIELGSYFRFKYKDDVMEHLDVESRVELFTSYVKDFGNIDINWQNVLIIRVNKWISVNYSSQLIYDDDVEIEIDSNNDGIVDKVGPRIQFKSILAAGLLFQFGEKRKP